MGLSSTAMCCVGSHYHNHLLIPTQALRCILSHSSVFHCHPSSLLSSLPLKDRSDSSKDFNTAAMSLGFSVVLGDLPLCHPPSNPAVQQLCHSLHFFRQEALLLAQSSASSPPPAPSILKHFPLLAGGCFSQVCTNSVFTAFRFLLFLI